MVYFWNYTQGETIAGVVPCLCDAVRGDIVVCSPNGTVCSELVGLFETDHAWAGSGFALGRRMRVSALTAVA